MKAFVSPVLSMMTAVALCATAAASMPVRLIIEDNAGLFSETARQDAKAKLARLQSPVNREVHIQTYKALPENQAKALAEAKGDNGKAQSVWESWATEHLRGERGLVVLINWDPGKVMVKADRAVSSAGYSNASANQLRERLIKSLGEAKKNNNEAERKKLLDEALADAVSLIATTLPLEKNRAGAPVPNNAAHAPVQGADNENAILGYVCVGLLGLMAVWFIVGLFRSATAGPSMAPAMGGGGGGFFSSLLGGMFGAAAGMWMYNSFFGTGSAWGAGNGWGGTNAGWGSGGDESGAGDFSGGSGSSGDFGGGDSGGSDFGGGGDFGGGDSGGGDF